MKETKNNKYVKIMMIAIVAVIYVMSMIAGLAQEFNCYVIESNYELSKKADVVTVDANDIVVSIEDINIKSIRTPHGTGEYFSLFEDENELWVSKELTIGESINLTYMFTILDTLAFCFVVWVIGFVDYEESVWTVCGIILEIAYLLIGSIFYEYANKVLFGWSNIGLVILIIRSLALSFVAVKFKNSNR